MELHILVTQWTIIDSHWKPGESLETVIFGYPAKCPLILEFCLIFWGFFFSSSIKTIVSC